MRVLAAAGISTRRACSLVGTARSHLAYEARPKDDAELLAVIAEIRRRKPRWGVRRTHRQLRRRGLAVNRKRVEHIWREHRLAVPARRRRRKLRTGASVPVAASYRSHVWTYDIVYDAVASGRTMKVLTVVDEFTRLALAVQGARSITAGAVKGVLTDLFERYGAPALMRSDNGGEFVASGGRRLARGDRHLPHRPGQPVAERLRRVVAAAPDAPATTRRRRASLPWAAASLAVTIRPASVRRWR